MMTETQAPAAWTEHQVAPAWIAHHYALVDAGDLAGYSADFADDVSLVFGGLPEVRGKAAVVGALGHGHAQHAMQHRVLQAWDVHGQALVHFEVTFTFPDGRVVVTPSMAHIVHDRHRIRRLQVFIDRSVLAPVTSAVS